MSANSGIEWTEATWNVTYGCTKVSPGCANCYIERTPPYRMEGMRFERGHIPVRLLPERLEWPLHWRQPRRIFVNSLSDLFHEAIPDEYLDRVFSVMALTPQHSYQLLTKRPERMREYLLGVHYRRRGRAPSGVVQGAEDGSSVVRFYTLPDELKAVWPLPNVWLGVTTENQRQADERIPALLDTPAAVRFVSCEPLLGPVSLRRYLVNGYEYGTRYDSRIFHENPSRLDWIIIGGESGPRHRPFNPGWARSLIAQCREANTAAFVKQMGGARPGGHLEDLPPDLRVRQYPEEVTR